MAEQGWSHVVLDGTLSTTDRLTETTTRLKGNLIDAWYSGKHHDLGANIHAIIPRRLPVWTSQTLPGTCTT